MKKNISSFILIAILIILVGAVIGLRISNENKKSAPTTKVFLENLKTDEINKVEIINAEKTLTLLKEADKWFELQIDRDKQEADSTSINTMLEKAKNIKIGESVTEKIEKQALFQVDNSGTEVKFYKDELKMADFYIGKTTADYNGNYLRLEGSNSIYSSAERIISYFNKTTFVKKTN